MPSETVDWDSVYRQEAEFPGPPPWNIGEPQPELAALLQAGKFRGALLDVGCGFAELSLAAAKAGHTVVGVDLTPTAVAAATKAAAARGLDNATYIQSDITEFTGYDGRFDTIVDSTLFHSLPVEARDAYQRAIRRAAAAGARYYVLVFATGAFPAGIEQGPNEVTEDELRSVVAKYWEIDEIEPAFIHANLSAEHFPPDVQLPPYHSDEKGRLKLPAFLLTAHKAD